MKAYNNNGRVTCEYRLMGRIDMTNGNEFISFSPIVESIPRTDRPLNINIILRHVSDSMEAFHVRKFIISMNLEVTIDQMIKNTKSSDRFLTLAQKAGMKFRKLNIFSDTFVFDFK